MEPILQMRKLGLRSSLPKVIVSGGRPGAEPRLPLPVTLTL